MDSDSVNLGSNPSRSAKLHGLPSWQMISLRESHDRREVMRSQFANLGYENYNFYLTNRWENINANVDIKWHYHEARKHHGSIISHLELMRQWYLTTDEPYAIFSDDDMDLSTCEYWNFNFEDFVKNLPDNWQFVQLIRVLLHQDNLDRWAELQMEYGRFWGVCALMSREYVRRVLNAHVTGPFQYDLRLIRTDEWDNNGDSISFIENVLYLEKAKPLNFPLFTELPNVSTITPELDRSRKRIVMDRYRELWKTQGPNLNIEQALLPR